jgi:hypothetical protein
MGEGEMERGWLMYTEGRGGITLGLHHTWLTTWLNLGDVILSEISQAQKDKYHVISLHVESKKR